MYNRYKGNGSRPIPVPDTAPPPKKPGAKITPAPVPAPPKAEGKALSALLQEKSAGLETEDLLLVLILYLMYRESGDRELLIIMGALFLL